MAVARFLRTCPGLSKSIVGDLLGQNNERCLRILDAFTHMFDFSGATLRAVGFPPASNEMGLVSAGMITFEPHGEAIFQAAPNAEREVQIGSIVDLEI